MKREKRNEVFNKKGQLIEYDTFVRGDDIKVKIDYFENGNVQTSEYSDVLLNINVKDEKKRDLLKISFWKHGTVFNSTYFIIGENNLRESLRITHDDPLSILNPENTTVAEYYKYEVVHFFKSEELVRIEFDSTGNILSYFEEGKRVNETPEIDYKDLYNRFRNKMPHFNFDKDFFDSGFKGQGYSNL